MIVQKFRASFSGTNCWLVAPGPGQQCLIIDPGYDIADGLNDAIESNNLHPVAVLLTHGHLDHVASVIPVCGARDVPAYVHPADRFMFTDPWKGLGLDPDSPFLSSLEYLPVTEPSDLRELTGDDLLELGDQRLRILHTPGHSEGSVSFSFAAADTGDETDLVFSGDLLFAGKIGMTDLPTGSVEAMTNSLRTVIWPMDDATVVHPGHGRSTTIGIERAENPHLRDLF